MKEEGKFRNEISDTTIWEIVDEAKEDFAKYLPNYTVTPNGEVLLQNVPPEIREETIRKLVECYLKWFGSE